MSLPDRDAVLLNLTQVEGRFSRGQNVLVERIDGVEGQGVDFASRDEVIVLCVEAEARVSGGTGVQIALPARSLSIFPPGSHGLEFRQAGRLFVLATHRADVAAGQFCNAAQYAEKDLRVREVGEPFRRLRDPDGICVFAVDDVPTPRTNPRIKFVQSATMSLNWVEYDGPRDRTALSPHAHADFEQGSLAIDGDFVHHIRTEWKSNADLWRDDRHIAASRDTLLVVPPEIIHTSEGIGGGHHILIDIFAPARRDFIARDWMHNADAYADPEAQEGGS